MQLIQKRARSNARVADHVPFLAKCSLGCLGKADFTQSLPIQVISYSQFSSRYSAKYFGLSA